VFGRLEEISRTAFARVASGDGRPERRSRLALPMPARLRPTAPVAADAILVGDPGRALLLAQELLEQPKMSNHARGLWGYTGRTPGGAELTVQATGMGGPSAAIVLADLAELGVRRAIRVGTCVALDPLLEAGELLTVVAVHDLTGPRPQPGDTVLPNQELTRLLRGELGGESRDAAVASLDVLRGEGEPAPPSAGDAVDMQSAALLSRGPALGVALAAILIVAETSAGTWLEDGELERAAKRAGAAAETVLSG
jgi:Phosphorylase superfamily